MKRHLRNLAKQAAVAIHAHGPGLARRMKRIADIGALPILNLHRVDDRHVSAYEAIPPRLFNDLLCWLRREFRVVTFGDLNDLSPEGKPVAILSFDDGYRDFIETVAPILGRHGLRANQNVIPACADAGEPPMNVMIQDFIGQAPNALLRETALPCLPSGFAIDDRIGLGIVIANAFKGLPIAEQKRSFAAIRPLLERYDDFTPTPMMSPAEIGEMAKLHEFGSHSYEHANMAAETDTYLAEDAARCRAWHKAVTGEEPAIYAFPNGSCRLGQEDVVLRAGYERVLLVGEQFSRTDRHVHTRFTMYGDSLPELRFRALGGLSPTS